MFEFMKSKAAKAKALADKKRKVKALAASRGIHLRESNFNGIGEDLLDLIIVAGIFDDLYYADFGVSEADIVTEVPAAEAEAFKEEVLAEAERARTEYETPTPTYDPDPEPVRSSGWGGSDSGYSSSDSGSSYSSSDSGGD